MSAIPDTCITRDIALCVSSTQVSEIANITFFQYIIPQETYEEG